MTKKQITFTLNGQKKEFWIHPEEKLLTLLRRYGYKGVKYGCGEGSCGSCTVIMDGKAIYSCILYAFQADKREIWTIEGVGDFSNPHPFQKALVQAAGIQCGFCTPGMVMSAKAMLDENPTPSEEEVKEYMDGNLCRCTGYQKIWDALQQVIQEKEGGNESNSKL